VGDSQVVPLRRRPGSHGVEGHSLEQVLDEVTAEPVLHLGHGGLMGLQQAECVASGLQGEACILLLLVPGRDVELDGAAVDAAAADIRDQGASTAQRPPQAVLLDSQRGCGGLSVRVTLGGHMAEPVTHDHFPAGQPAERDRHVCCVACGPDLGERVLDQLSVTERGNRAGELLVDPVQLRGAPLVSLVQLRVDQSGTEEMTEPFDHEELVGVRLAGTPQHEAARWSTQAGDGRGARP
jgi:hypothetical protein